MRRAKVITALVLTAVMLTVMTGIAVATPSTTTSPASVDVDISTNTPTTITVKHIIEPGDYLADAISFRLTRTQGNVTDLELQFKQPSAGTESGIYEREVNFTWTNDSDPDYLELWVKAKSGAPVGAEYDIIIWDWGWGTHIDVSAATVTATNIPEFATIALPVAAILGLLFFFNRRKHKKE